MPSTENTIHHPISNEALDQIFRTARTYSVWLPKSVVPETLSAMYDLAKLGPTSANTSPARFVFLTTPEAKARLIPCLAPGNVEKTQSAPVNVIIAWDTKFYDHLLKLFPHRDMRALFANNLALAEETALRNGSLQGGYLILAARSLGLDCGPMSGFDPAKVDAEFFPDGHWRANFLCNLGYGDGSKLLPRGPRMSFEEACQIL